MYYGSGTVDRSASGGSWRTLRHMRRADAACALIMAGSTFLREMTSWKCDVKSKIRIRQSMRINLMEQSCQISSQSKSKRPMQAHAVVSLCLFSGLWQKKAAIQKGSFPKKKNSGNAEFKRRRREDRAPKAPMGVGQPPPQTSSPRKIFRFWILNRWILVQTECFLYSSSKVGLNAVWLTDYCVPGNAVGRSHCQNNFGNAVPRRSCWKRLVGLCWAH